MIHAIVCPLRRRWLRWRWHMPFWRDDHVAEMLGIAQFGCPRCGRGSVEERDANERSKRETSQCEAMRRELPDNAPSRSELAAEEAAEEVEAQFLEFCRLYKLDCEDPDSAIQFDEWLAEIWDR